MRILHIIIIGAISPWALIAGEALAQPQDRPVSPAKFADTCVQCHAGLPEPSLSAPVSTVQGDVHGRRGLSCVGCHGGDPAQSDAKLAMEPRRGFAGKPAPRAVAAFCGKCHSNAEFMRQYNPGLRVDQAAEYETSMHGKLAAKGDMSVATCAACHGYHGIRSIAEPQSPVYPTNVAATCGRCHSNPDYMRPYSIPVDQAQKYQTSVHAETLMQKLDLSAPTCNDCHGNHGAVPPGASSVANVCGTCHVRQAELFGRSPHNDVFDTLGLGQCLVCHSNHDVQHPSDSMIGVQAGSVCVDCHSDGEPGYEAARLMRAGLDTLGQHLEQAATLLDLAARAGMEVSRPRFELTSAQGKQVDARVVIHSFSANDVQSVVQPGIEIAQRAHRAGEEALGELEFRRKGLAASLVVITLAILAIYLKIRNIEMRRRLSDR